MSSTVSIQDRDNGECMVEINGCLTGRHRVKGTVTASGMVVENWVRLTLDTHRRRLNDLVVGLDVKWYPNIGPGVDGPPAVLQLCVGHRCLVFQIFLADYVPPVLADFLADKRFMFVGAGVDDDAETLKSHYGLEVGPETLDLRVFLSETSHRVDVREQVLATMAELVMGLDYGTPTQVEFLGRPLSRWTEESLSLDQIMNAITDGFVSFEIGRIIFVGIP